MKAKCRICGNQLKKVDSWTDIIWGKFYIWYCKNCKRIVNETEVKR